MIPIRQFRSETRGLGALPPPCSAQVYYLGYPMDIRIGNLSPFIPSFPVSQTDYPYWCRTHTNLTPTWISPGRWMHHPLPRGSNTFTSVAKGGITVLPSFFIFHHFLFCVGFRSDLGPLFPLYASENSWQYIFLILAQKAAANPLRRF